MRNTLCVGVLLLAASPFAWAAESPVAGNDSTGLHWTAGYQGGVNGSYYRTVEDADTTGVGVGVTGIFVRAGLPFGRYFGISAEAAASGWALPFFALGGYARTASEQRRLLGQLGFDGGPRLRGCDVAARLSL